MPAFDLAPLLDLVALGGPVVAVLSLASIITLAVMLYKLWQFRAAGVGQHKALADAVALWDRGEVAAAETALARSRSYLHPVVRMGMQAQQTPGLAERLQAEAESRFLKLERGLRLLDTVAQMAPLLGLFGTVLGMIEAFQALQDAGDSVDPSVLAGGIWVALLTTAVGLAVAMPAALVLSWLEGRMDRERVFAEAAIRRILAPGAVPARPATHAA